jgi:hypothetical protein
MRFLPGAQETIVSMSEAPADLIARSIADVAHSASRFAIEIVGIPKYDDCSNRGAPM